MPTLKERLENINVKAEFEKAKARLENFDTKAELNKIKETFETKVKTFDVKEGFNKAKVQADKINDFALETTEGTLEAIFTTGEKWNGVATKAVNVGLKLSEKQMDLFFNTLEAVKGQMEEGAERFKKLIKNENKI